MSISLMALSFLAGILTTLSPCALPVLPIIVGGASIQKSPFKIFLMTFSLTLAVIGFTLLLKVSTFFIKIPNELIHFFSGGLIFFLGVLMLFPFFWDRVVSFLKLDEVSNHFLKKSLNIQGSLGIILTGLALGAIFSSCSPTYAFILASVFPLSFISGLVYLLFYAAGFFLCLYLLGILGHELVRKFAWAVNPEGWFKRGLAIIFMFFGVLFILGLDQKSTILNKNFLNATNLESFFSKQSDKGQFLHENEEEESLNLAPEMVGVSNWINSSPLTMRGLKGKVVLLDFWSYTCVSCLKALPHVVGWYETYKNNNFVIIGIHTPQFSFEKIKVNVEKFARENEMTYPIVMDNNFLTWKAYNVYAWPSLFLIDKDGIIRYTHLGEGNYEETEEAIRSLILEMNPQAF